MRGCASSFFFFFFCPSGLKCSNVALHRPLLKVSFHEGSETDLLTWGSVNNRPTILPLSDFAPGCLSPMGKGHSHGLRHAAVNEPPFSCFWTGLSPKLTSPFFHNCRPTHNGQTQRSTFFFHQNFPVKSPFANRHEKKKMLKFPGCFTILHQWSPILMMFYNFTPNYPPHGFRVSDVSPNDPFIWFVGRRMPCHFYMPVTPGLS